MSSPSDAAPANQVEKTASEPSKKKTKKNKKKKLRGFPSIIQNQVKILNDSEEFTEKFGDVSLNLLIIATDDRRAAIVRIDGGNISVDQVKTKAEEIQLVKKQIKARITTDTATFLGLAIGKVDPVEVIFKGKPKLKRIKKVLLFTKIFPIIKQELKQNKVVE